MVLLNAFVCVLLCIHVRLVVLIAFESVVIVFAHGALQVPPVEHADEEDLEPDFDGDVDGNNYPK